VAGVEAPTEEPLHGQNLLPLLLPRKLGGHPGRRFAQAAAERPIFVEIGYGRAVLRGEWKLLVINDGTDRCREPTDGTCRNLHDEEIDRFQCNFTANGHMGNREKGRCNMTYDAVARHAGFCDRRQVRLTTRSDRTKGTRTPANKVTCTRNSTGMHSRGLHTRGTNASDVHATHTHAPHRRSTRTHPAHLPAVVQLYNTRLDPLEQRNVVGEQPELYDELLALLIAHVRTVEQRNPAIAGAQARKCKPAKHAIPPWCASPPPQCPPHAPLCTPLRKGGRTRLCCRPPEGALTSVTVQKSPAETSLAACCAQVSQRRQHCSSATVAGAERQKSCVLRDRSNACESPQSTTTYR
jgi:hypothetical protein